MRPQHHIIIVFQLNILTTQGRIYHVHYTEMFETNVKQMRREVHDHIDDANKFKMPTQRYAARRGSKYILSAQS